MIWPASLPVVVAILAITDAIKRGCFIAIGRLSLFRKAGASTYWRA
jgi:hypothetical protein